MSFVNVYYHCSTRQLAKIENNKPLLLAIPLIAGTDKDDIEAIAEDSLPDVPVDCIDEIWVGHVTPTLFNRGGGGENSLDSFMGELVSRSRNERWLSYSVKAVLVSINGAKAARIPAKWPGSKAVLAHPTSEK